jgi:hypothetical protein
MLASQVDVYVTVNTCYVIRVHVRCTGRKFELYLVLWMAGTFFKCLKYNQQWPYGFAAVVGFRWEKCRVSLREWRQFTSILLYGRSATKTSVRETFDMNKRRFVQALFYLNNLLVIRKKLFSHSCLESGIRSSIYYNAGNIRDFRPLLRCWWDLRCLVILRSAKW